MRHCLLALISLFVFSCSSSDDIVDNNEEAFVENEDSTIEDNNGVDETEGEPDTPEEDPNPTEDNAETESFRYKLSNMMYPFGIAPWPPVKDVIIYKDSEGNITKRVGDIYDANLVEVVGFSYYFSELISDIVKHEDNKIVIEETSDDPQLTIPTYKRTLLLDDNGKVIQKVTETSNPVSRDTLNFAYDTSGKISKIIYVGSKVGKESTFHFNTDNNLDSIVTTQYDVETDTSIKVLEKFEEYDTAENPVKDYFFFEELFFRSLSENNFSHYLIKTTTREPFNSRQRVSFRQWHLKYDSQGNVLFDSL